MLSKSNFGAPLPDPYDQDTAPFWEACKSHEYVIQRCSDCGTYRYPPRPICHNCGSWASEWQPHSGWGEIYSYTIANHPPHPLLADLVPYALVVVELSDTNGERVIGKLLDYPQSVPTIGRAVVVAWEHLERGVVLPQWRLQP